ncbi:PilZ domain-containing protein [Tautonia sp. JC769]|uniref:PilZ domain-containing protein n=1 Tax=Tautonia sp. JC769 TaxID=3232135 RepID=UPI0034587452
MGIRLLTNQDADRSTPEAPYSGMDRRRATRFEAVEDRIWLGWWDGEVFQTLGALLLDISRTGAAIICPDGPSEQMDAWFCIVGPSLSGGARARVVGREPIPDRPDQLRLRLEFQPTCPEDLYLVALGLLSNDWSEAAREGALSQVGSM